MTRTVGERWEEYLRLGRRMSPHTIAAYPALADGVFGSRGGRLA